MKVLVEVTDTFCGEANYSWVSRYRFNCPDDASDLSIVRRAKTIAGYSGVRCRKENIGDLIALYPAGICHVIFITFDQE